MTDRELMRQALDALEGYARNCRCEGGGAPCDAAEALRARLAQPEQEPVAWMHIMDNTEGIEDNGTGIVSITQKRKHPFGKPGIDFSKSYPVTSTPLYTAPPQREWQGLTDEEIAKIASTPCAVVGSYVHTFARAIEAKLKEKNT